MTRPASPAVQSIFGFYDKKPYLPEKEQDSPLPGRGAFRPSRLFNL